MATAVPTRDESIRLKQLLRIANAVNSTLDLGTVLKTIIDTVCSETDWTMACLAAINEATHEVAFTVERGFRSHPSEVPRWSIDESLTPRATASGKTIAITDTLRLRNFPAVRSSSILRGFRSVLITPLKHVSPTTALWLCRQQPTHFAEDDIAFAEAVANQAAVAIRNAELYKGEKSRAEDLARANQTLEVLTRMVLEDRALTDIQASVASLLRNPLWFEDRSGQRTPRGGGPCVPNCPPDGQPVRWNVGDRTALAIPVLAGTEFYGWLLSLDECHAFTKLDQQIMQQATLVFALTFLRDRVRHDVESQLRTDLFASLMAREGSEPGEDLERRARALGITFPNPGRVCILQPQPAAPRTQPAFRPMLAEALRLAVTRLPHRLVCLHEDAVAMLIGPGEDDGLTELSAQLGCYFSDSHPLLALGDITDADTDYLDSLYSAQKALRIGRFLGVTQPVLRSDDLGLFALLFDERRTRELETYRRRILGALRERDRKGLFWSTLECLYLNNFNLQATARQLAIHISTLRYRLQRIRTITGRSWDDAEARLQLEVAIVIERWRRHTLGGQTVS